MIKVSSLVRGSVGLFAAAMLVAMPASAADFKLTKSTMVYNGGQRYFRGAAGGVRLGSYGQKKTPINAPNYLMVEDHIPSANIAKVKVDIGGPESIDWSKYSQTDVQASGTTAYVNNAGAQATFSQTTQKNAKLVLVRMTLTRGQAEELLNKYAGKARKAMKDEGGDARIVSTVWVVMEAQLASQMQSSGSLNASGTANGLEVDVKVSNTSATTTKVTIPPGATFAYGLMKVKKWKGELVDDMEDDLSGLN